MISMQNTDKAYLLISPITSPMFEIQKVLNNYLSKLINLYILSKPNYLLLLPHAFHNSLPLHTLMECLFLPTSSPCTHLFSGELLFILQDQDQMSPPIFYFPDSPGANLSELT